MSRNDIKKTASTFMNTFKEKHGFIEGIYAGYSGKPGVDKQVLEKYEGDVWYVKGGFVIGSALSTKTMWFAVGLLAGYGAKNITEVALTLTSVL